MFATECSCLSSSVLKTIAWQCQVIRGRRATGRPDRGVKNILVWQDLNKTRLETGLLSARDLHFSSDMVAVDIGSRKFQRFAVSGLSLFSQAQFFQKGSADNMKVRVALQRAGQSLQAGSDFSV